MSEIANALGIKGPFEMYLDSSFFGKVIYSGVTILIPLQVIFFR